MEKLTERYLSLLTALQNNPFGTADELAEAAKISKPTVLRRLQALNGSDDVYEDSDLPSGEQYFVVKPLLNFRELGLEQVDALIDVKHADMIEQLEEIAKSHPYTIYRSRCFGSVNGLLLQFAVPLNSSPLIKELFEKLTETDSIARYKILPTSKSIPIYSSMKIDGWDADQRTWNFDWSEWFKLGKSSKIKRVEEREPTTSLEWLTKDDVFIISELMRSARRKNTEIISALEEHDVAFTPQTFGRHLKIINDRCIRGYRVTFHPIFFETLAGVLIYGTSDPKILGALKKKFEKNPPPFESTLRVHEDKIFWYLRIPQSLTNPFLNEAIALIEFIDMCYLDYRNSLLYYIWPKTFDEDSHSWRKDISFLLHDVIKK